MEQSPGTDRIHSTDTDTNNAVEVDEQRVAESQPRLIELRTYQTERGDIIREVWRRGLLELRFTDPPKGSGRYRRIQVNIGRLSSHFTPEAAAAAWRSNRNR